MMPKKSWKNKVEEINAQINELCEQKAKIVKSVQSRCEHPIESVREIPYYGTDIRPRRVCIECGYAEEGWGCGYYKLHASVYSGIFKDPNAGKYIRTFLSQEKLSEIRFGKKLTDEEFIEFIKKLIKKYGLVELTRYMVGEFWVSVNWKQSLTDWSKGRGIPDRVGKRELYKANKKLLEKRRTR